MPEPFSLRSKWTILPFLKFILTPRLHHAVQSPDMLFFGLLLWSLVRAFGYSYFENIQSGASSRSKIGGALFLRRYTVLEQESDLE